MFHERSLHRVDRDFAPERIEVRLQRIRFDPPIDHFVETLCDRYNVAQDLAERDVNDCFDERTRLHFLLCICIRILFRLLCRSLFFRGVLHRSTLTFSRQRRIVVCRTVCDAQVKDIRGSESNCEQDSHEMHGK